MADLAPDFAGRLIAWHARHGRHDLPWQNTRDAYRIWLSEIMLQQTQVTTVMPYYARFLDRFPDIRALAAAPVEDVMALWSGLGYYARARNLHACARAVVGRHGGEFPRDAIAIAELPGIGRSTAAAIAAFCWGERVAILDGNARRVLCRVLGFDGDLSLPRETSRLWALAESLLPDRGIESYTQGLMDLGAGVCLPRAPACDACPLAGICAARTAGRPEAYPVRSRRAVRGQVHTTWLWLRRGQALWLVQRAPRGVWGGLWSLPEFDSIDAARQALQGLSGSAHALPPFVHVLTHRDWTLQPLRWDLPSRPVRAVDARLSALWPQGRWFDASTARSLALPAPLRRLLSTGA